MEYSKLISVTGLPGLFELVASKNDGAIVRSLDDKSTKFVSSRIHNFSHLESIEVYTEGDNVNLAEVFNAMQSNTEALPNEKDASAVKKYFEKVYPAMDFDRVYASDMKKMVKWFDVLKKNDVEIKLSEETSGDEESDEEKPDPNEQPETKPKIEEPVVTPAVEAEPKKAKAAKAKKEEALTASEDTPAETDTNAAKKKNTKK